MVNKGLNIQRIQSKSRATRSPIRHSKCIIQNSSFETSGFTLVEIITAIFIFSIIVTTIFGSYNAVFSDVATINESMGQSDMAQACLNRMTADLQAVWVSTPPVYAKPEFNAPPDPYRIYGKTENVGDSSFGRLRLASLAHLPLYDDQTGGIAEIVYYVQEMDEKYVLRRGDRRFPFSAEFEESNWDPVVCENIRALTFTYHDTEETFEEWDSDAAEFGYATPRAISISFAIGDEDRLQTFKTTVFLFSGREKIE
jgi:general secretion pathway protein J